MLDFTFETNVFVTFCRVLIFSSVNYVLNTVILRKTILCTFLNFQIHRLFVLNSGRSTWSFTSKTHNLKFILIDFLSQAFLNFCGIYSIINANLSVFFLLFLILSSHLYSCCKDLTLRKCACILFKNRQAFLPLFQNSTAFSYN